MNRTELSVTDNVLAKLHKNTHKLLLPIKEDDDGLGFSLRTLPEQVLRAKNREWAQRPDKRQLCVKLY